MSVLQVKHVTLEQNPRPEGERPTKKTQLISTYDLFFLSLLSRGCVLHIA